MIKRNIFRKQLTKQQTLYVRTALRSTTLQPSSQVLGELSWDLNRPTSSEWCMPMNLISMRVRIINPFIQIYLDNHIIQSKNIPEDRMKC